MTRWKVINDCISRLLVIFSHVADGERLSKINTTTDINRDRSGHFYRHYHALHKCFFEVLPPSPLHITMIIITDWFFSLHVLTFRCLSFVSDLTDIHFESSKLNFWFYSFKRKNFKLWSNSFIRRSSNSCRCFMLLLKKKYKQEIRSETSL